MDDFVGFARRQGPALSRLAFLLCGDQGHAEDLVQLALWKTYRSWGHIEQVDFPVAYVRQILVREYLSWRRRRWTTEVVSMDLDQDSAHGSTGSDPADHVADADAVRHLLKSLPRKQRAVLVMRYYLDLPDAEIAESMGCSQNAVRSNAMRGLQKLRSSLPSHSEEALRETD